MNQKTNRTGFDRFELDASILRGIEAAGFESPRPIQAKTIPAAMDGRDVLGLAQTGTGKTAAFALPMLHRFAGMRRRRTRALVLAPTRELATQIDAEIRSLARFTPVTVATIYGGVPQRRQVQALRRDPDIVVGCPGRILDLMDQGLFPVDGIQTLVLDEADHMFDMGFLPGLRRILKKLPAERQNLLFSATMPREIRGLANEILHDPHTVELESQGPARTIEHVLVPVREDRKRDLLEHILGLDQCETAIVFTRTKHRARRLAEQLDKAGHRAVSLQGNMSQSQRDRAMKGFRTGRYDVLVATDIVARGIDVQGVSHVINFDVPNTPDAYTHRIGRTGRAEREGRAVTFATSSDAEWLRATERQLGTPITREAFAGFEGERIESRPQQRQQQNNWSNRQARPGSRGPARSRRSSSRRRARATG